jgi:hypothetical protein
MSVSNEDAVKANEAAIKALEESIQRLLELRRGKSLDDRDAIDTEISVARAEIIQITSLNEHLRAATVVIAAMNPAVEQKLQSLADRLDEAIRQDALLNARLETVLDVMKTAREVAGIISDNKA